MANDHAMRTAQTIARYAFTQETERITSPRRRRRAQSSAPGSCSCVTQRCTRTARPGPCLLRTCSEVGSAPRRAAIVASVRCPKPAGGRALHATHAPVRRRDSMQWAMGDGRSAAGGADGGAMIVV